MTLFGSGLEWGEWILNACNFTDHIVTDLQHYYLLYSIKMYVIEKPDKLEKLGFESGSVWFVKYDFRDKPDSEIFYFSLFNSFNVFGTSR